MLSDETIKAVANNIDWFSLEHAQIWFDYIKQMQPLENNFKDFMEEQFNRQEEKIKDNLQSMKSLKALAEGDVEEILFSLQEENNILIEQSGEHYRRTIQSFGSSGLDTVGVGIDFNLQNPRVQEFLENKEFLFADQVNTTTREKLRNKLLEGIDEGESIPDLANRVEDTFNDARQNRSQMIARTEVNGASNFGAHEGYQQSGVVERKNWIAALDERTRAWHRTEHFDSPVPIDDTFTVGGEAMRFPGDPNGSARNVIQCRCTLVPITEEG